MATLSGWRHNEKDAEHASGSQRQTADMIGTLLNAAGILIGGSVGLATSRQLSQAVQHRLKLALGVLTVFVGLKLTWTSLGGSSGEVTKRLLILVVALMAGRFTGHLLRLQKLSNRLGQFAKDRIASAADPGHRRFSEGFVTCALLYCVGPMAILGALQDGLAGAWQVLGLKAVIDGLTTMAFAPMFGVSALLAVIPVVAYQGTLTLVARVLALHLQPALVDSINATGGLLVFSVALVILEIKKVELADYLPSLMFAPLLTWIWK